MQQHMLDREGFVWALSAMCELNRIAFDPALVLQRFGAPYSTVTLERAARSLGFRVAVRRARARQFVKLKGACIALLTPRANVPGQFAEGASVSAGTKRDVGTGETSNVLGSASDGEALRLTPALVLRADGERVLALEQGEVSPREFALADFDTRFSGIIVQYGLATKKPSDPDALGAAKPFGFTWFIPELLKHKRIWRDVLLASFAIQLMALATPLFTQVIIDKVIVHRTTNTLLVIAAAMAMFVLFTGAMTWVRQYLILHTGNRVDAVLGQRVLEHLFQVVFPYFQARPTGVIVARLLGVESIRTFVAGAAVTLILDCPFLLIFLAIMLYYSWELTLIAVSVLALIVALSFAVAPLIRDRLNAQFLLGARNQAFLTEYVSAIETVKSLQMEPKLVDRYGAYLADYLRAAFRTRQLSNTYNVIANGLEQILTLAILVVGAMLVMENAGLTVGMLVAFQMFASRLSQPMLRLVGLWQEFQQAAISVARLGDIMNAPAEPTTLAPAKIAASQGVVEFDKVSFRYADERPYVVRDLSFTVTPGSCFLLTGKSGSGKSTVAKLLLGFYPLTEGTIRIDGRDARHFAVNELRQYFGVVPQETVLFSGTVYDNVVAGSATVSAQDVEQACRAAEIHDFIETLPQGYQTEIGEHGAGLSGGQKQRIAIARALVRRPRVLIFDEATSNLDNETAEQLGTTIARLAAHVTVIMITHQAPVSLGERLGVRLE